MAITKSGAITLFRDTSTLSFFLCKQTDKSAICQFLMTPKPFCLHRNGIWLYFSIAQDHAYKLDRKLDVSHCN